jgi:predicted signal transduction protein with EAL and GGDEF domain
VYQSTGGSISVSWSGTALSINSISPAAGFVAAIEDSSWDKVRVDFESTDGNSGEGHDDSRIEVRLHEGSIRVSID